jgi:hypothetical protein
MSQNDQHNALLIKVGEAEPTLKRASIPIPEGAKISSDEHEVEISRVTFSLGLVKEGFAVNVYAKQ